MVPDPFQAVGESKDCKQKKISVLALPATGSSYLMPGGWIEPGGNGGFAFHGLQRKFVRIWREWKDKQTYMLGIGGGYCPMGCAGSDMCGGAMGGAGGLKVKKK